MNTPTRKRTNPLEIMPFPLLTSDDTSAKKGSIIGVILWHCKHNTLRKYCYWYTLDFCIFDIVHGEVDTGSK